MKHKSRFLLPILTFVTFGMVAGSISTPESFIEETRPTPIVKSATDTTYNTSQIIIHIIDDTQATSSGHDFWIHAWDIKVDTSRSIFTDINNAYDTEGAFWDSMSRSNYDKKATASESSINMPGNYEWFTDGNYGRRSYKFAFPWWITDFKYQITLDGNYCETRITDARSSYERRYFKTVDAKWKLDGYAGATVKYDAPAYSMEFETNGGSSQPLFKFREWEKTVKPSDPVKFGSEFDTWVDGEDNEFVFGSNLTEPVELYATWEDGMSNGVILWKLPSGAEEENFKHCYVWNAKGENNTFPGTDCSSRTVTIGGNTYYYYAPTIANVTNVIFCKGTDGHNDWWTEKTNDITVSSDVLTGGKYWDLKYGDHKNNEGNYPNGSKWTTLSLSITYNNHAGATPSSALPTSFTFGCDPFDIPTLSKTGYTFDGWFTGDNGTGEQISSLGGYGYLTNQVLYAKWTIHTWSLNWNFNCGEISGAYTEAGTYDYNTSITRPTVSKDNTAFKGWSDGGSNTRMPDNNLTLTAQWYIDYDVEITDSLGLTIKVDPSYISTYGLKSAIVSSPDTAKLDGTIKKTLYDDLEGSVSTYYMYADANAAQLTDTITIRFYTTVVTVDYEGAAYNTFEVNVADIVDEKILQSGDMGRTNLCTAIMAYGSYVQLEFGHNTSDLAINHITDTDLKASILADIAAVTFSSEPAGSVTNPASGPFAGDSSKIGMSAGLDSKLTYRFYFECSDEDLSKFSATVAAWDGAEDKWGSGEWSASGIRVEDVKTEIVGSTTKRYFEITGFKPYQIYKGFTLTVSKDGAASDFVANYTIGKYLYKMYNYAGSGDLDKNVAKALKVYYDYAKAYKAALAA